MAPNGVRLSQLRRVAARVMVLSALLAGPALGEPAVVGATTYLRQGPGIAYRPVDEAVAGLAVEQRGCSAGWCLVRIGDRIGYLREAALATASPAATLGGTRSCFLNREAGYGEGRDLLICHADAAGR